MFCYSYELLKNDIDVIEFLFNLSIWKARKLLQLALIFSW